MLLACMRFMLHRRRTDADKAMHSIQVPSGGMAPCRHCSCGLLGPDQEHEAGTFEAMRSVTAFFGEDWDEADPARVLRVVRDFVALFDKCMAEMEVRAWLGKNVPGCSGRHWSSSTGCALWRM